MSFFTTDHGEAASPFDPVKPGKYEVVITQATVEPSKSSDNMLIRVIYTIRTDVEQEFQKRKVFDNYTASPKAMFKFQQAAKAIGLPSGVAVESLDAFAAMILFKPVRISVRNKKEMYQGEEKLKEEVTFIDAAKVPYSGGEGPTTDPFAVPGGTEYPPLPEYEYPPSDSESDLDTTPPWERTEDVESKPTDPFADDGKPMDISEEDLPF